MVIYEFVKQAYWHACSIWAGQSSSLYLHEQEAEVSNWHRLVQAHWEDCIRGNIKTL
jgi:hypothetical protein